MFSSYRLRCSLHSPRAARRAGTALVLGLSASCGSALHIPDAAVDSADGGAGQPDAAGPLADAGALRTDATLAGDTGTTPPATCARADLTVTRTIPTVWLLVDGSGSMGDGFAGLVGASRWSVLRDVLMDATNGLVARLSGSVAFGLMIYDGGLSAPGVYVPGLCPRAIVVPPATNQLAALTAAYPGGPTGASTPTHYALEDLAKRIADAGPSPTGPTYVVLATDGKPNLCDFHDGIPASAATEQEAVATVAELAAKGTKSFAISMAGNDPALQAHLDAVAQAGATGQPAFTPTSKDALVDALTQLIGGTTSCDVRVEGSIVAGRECAGDVSLNGTPLVCNAADGYRVKEDRMTLQLVGAACSTLQGTPSAQVKASFACEDVVLR